ncbi:hypothetical protein SNE40_002237 [Patella caerulea]|uniref:Uncharacterized protein n=1 Tax=Patella caerulea TaxID=87958 RepID=A0AAN8KBV0_PATCE
MNLVFRGNQTATNFSKHKKTTNQEDVILDERNIKKKSLHPAEDKALISTPRICLTKPLLNGSIRISMVSEKAKATRMTLMDIFRNCGLSITMIVNVLPLKPMTRNTGIAT